MLLIKKYKHFRMVFFVCFLFLVLLIANSFNLKLSISDLSGNGLFSYQYSLRTEYKALNNITLTNDKYLLDKVSITNIYNNTVFTININKTISRNHLVSDLIPKIKSIKFAIMPNNTKPSYQNSSISMVKLFIISIFCVLSINVALLCVKKLFIKIFRYIQNDFISDEQFDMSTTFYGYLFIILTLLIVFLSYVTHFINLNIFFNSDELFLIDLFNSLSNGAHLKDWYLTTVPFYFPDYIIFTIAYLITSSTYWNFIIFAILQILVTTVLLNLLLRKFLSKNTAFIASAINILIWTYCAILYDAFQPILLSVFHFGTILNIIIFGIIIFENKNSNKSKYSSIRPLLAFGIALIATISDLWFIIWCILPLLISVFYLRLSKHKYCTNLLVVLTGSIGAFLGLISAKYAVYHYVTSPISISIFHFGMLAKKTFYFCKFILSNLIFVSLFIFFISFVSAYYKKYSSLLSNNILLIICYISMLPVIFIVIYCVDSIDFNLRYLIPLAYFSVCFAVIYLLFKYRIRLLNMIFCLSLLFVLYLLLQPKYIEFYPYDIKCFDDALVHSDVSTGVAQYWTARRFNYLTKTDRHIVQINGETGKHNVWQDYIYNESKSYDFVISNTSQLEDLYKIDISTVITKNGAPVKTTKCNDDTIMIYNHKQVVDIK